MTIKKITFWFAVFIAFSLQGQTDLKDLVAKCEKAVCAIYTYDDFGVPDGMGTGFFIEPTGIGITNYHVLGDAATAIVKASNGKTYRVKEILESNKTADIIKFSIENSVDTQTFTCLTCNKAPLMKGEKIFVIGNPNGFESTVSEGIVSSIRESEDYEQVIQITAPISPGSSGSPVMTMDGKVVGIATFQYSSGQNLNFAVAANMINKLTPTRKELTANVNRKFFVINEKCSENSELVLNSIEFGDNETTLNFSFTNVSLGYGEHMVIWTKLNTKDETFFIQDIASNQKYYATGSTIGTAREDATQIPLGQTKRFKVFFPPMTPTGKINILEGISSSWNFMNLDLTKHLKIEDQNTVGYDKQYALTKLENKDFEQAKLLLSSNVEKNKADDESMNILGIISYILDNNYDALNYFSKAIDINPKNDIYYFNRYKVYYSGKRNFEAALSDITLAIKSRPNQGDYYQHRAQVYMALKDYEKAVSDYDVAITMMGDNWYLYKSRGNCKTWLNDFQGACRDWQKAYKLSDYSDDKLKEQISKNCR